MLGLEPIEATGIGWRQREDLATSGLVNLDDINGGCTLRDLATVSPVNCAFKAKEKDANALFALHEL